MKSFSLSTLLLVVVIVALGVSQILLLRQLSLARAEVNDVRRKYGYIHVTDQSKTYVAQIAENENPGDAYRIRIPKGSRYVLHLTDAEFETNEAPKNPVPTKTISLNDGSQVTDTTLSCIIYSEKQGPRVVVYTKTDAIFDYLLPDWKGTVNPSEWTWLQSAGQTEYSTDQNIPFLLWRDKTTHRGMMLWLEPYATWEARQRQSGTQDGPKESSD